MADKEINTSGGPVIEKDINTNGGDFIGRDTINKKTSVDGNVIVTIIAVLCIGTIAIIAINFNTPGVVPPTSTTATPTSTVTQTTVTTDTSVAAVRLTETATPTFVQPTVTPMPAIDTLIPSPTIAPPTETPTSSPTSTPIDVPPSSTVTSLPDGAYSIAMSFKISPDTSNGAVIARISESPINSTNVYSVIYRIASTSDGYLEIAIFDGVLRKCNMYQKGGPLRIDDNNWIIIDMNIEDGGGPGILLNTTEASRNDGYHERCDPITDNGTPVTLPPSETSPIGQVCLFDNILSLEKKVLLFESPSGICL